MSRMIRLYRLVAVPFVALMLAACGSDDDSSTGPSTQATLQIKNSSSRTIVTVNFSSCSESSWGTDRLGENETIAPGAERSWQVAPGCYDIRAVASTGGDAEWFDRELTAGQTRTFTATGSTASASGMVSSTSADRKR